MNVQERALEVQADFAAQLKQIRCDTSLSDDGKRSAIADAFTRSRDKLQRLHERAQQESGRRRRELERRLFGLHATSDTATLSYRDAQERVSRVKRLDEALNLLQRADRSGDEVLARAVAAHAWDRAWTRVLDRYAAERPGVLDQLQELDELERSSVRQSTGGRMISGMAHRLSVPAELRGVRGDAALRTMATI